MQAGQGRQGRAGSADKKARQAEHFWNCWQAGKGRAIRLGGQVLPGQGWQCRQEGQAGRAFLELLASREGKGNQARRTDFGWAGLAC